MIPITKPFLGEEEVKLASQAILSGWVTQGPRVKEFENQFAGYVGASHACAVSSCTTALHLALLAVGVKPGDVVITVSHSFIATANSARYCGAEPVFVDVEKDGVNISPECLEKVLKEECEQRKDGLYYKKVTQLVSASSPLNELSSRPLKTRGRVAAILVVHQLGFPCQMKRILDIAKRFGVVIVEDAAYAIGSEVAASTSVFERIGKPHGEIACFSFHPRKMLVTGEGGMLTTNNNKYDEFFRLYRHQGMGVSDLARHQSNKVIFENYVVTGFNYRMSDIQASIGIAQLKKMPTLLARLKEVASFYNDKLKSISWIKTPLETIGSKVNWCTYPIRLMADAPLDQERLMQCLLNQGISTRPGVMNTHRQKPYQSNIWNLPETEKARDLTVLLPAFYQITDEELGIVVGALQKI